MQEKKFTIDISTKDTVCVVDLGGYLSHGLTESLLPPVEQKLQEGFSKFVFDLSAVTMLESPAVACILTLTEKIVDDVGGDLVFCGLNEMVIKVLEMVGVFLYASHCKTKESAFLECAE